MPFTLDEGKRMAALAAADMIAPGQRIGLGTGSTAAWFIRLLGERVNHGLALTAVATSEASEQLARDVGIPIIPFADAGELDVTVDGADELDRQLNLIKGGGGALLREKIVAYHSRQLIIIADDSKYTDVLGAFPLPVEIIPFWWQATVRAVNQLGSEPQLRQRNGATFVTDNGNYILDCPFNRITDPAALHNNLKQIPGVVETGLFLEMAQRAILGGAQGIRIITPQ